MASKLHETYTRYKEQANRLQRELAEVRTKMEALEEAGAGDPEGQGSLPLLRAILSDSDIPVENIQTLTGRVETLVNSIPPEQKWTRNKIQKTLTSSGYVPKGDHFKVTLFKTLMRLKEQKKIDGEKRDGKWEFYPVSVL